MINTNPKFESNPMTLEQEILFKSVEFEKQVSKLKVQRGQLEKEIAELELEYEVREDDEEYLDKLYYKKAMLKMINDTIGDAENLFNK